MLGRHFRSSTRRRTAHLGDHHESPRLDAAGLLNDLLEELVRWDEAPPWLLEWLAAEREAVSLRWYEQAYVPGLLQTEAYANAVFGSDGRYNADEVERRVAARLARQGILHSDNPPHVQVALDESVVHRPIGGPKVMQEQLRHLARLNVDHRRVRIQIVPASVGAYAGLDGPLIIAKLANGEEMVYLDNRLQGQIVTRAEDVVFVREAWEATLSEALTPQQSTQKLVEVAETWT